MTALRMKSPPNPNTRQGVMRELAAEANILMDEAKITRDRIRALGRRIRNELNMDQADFMVGVRINRLARLGQRTRVENVREVVFALGDALPRVTVASEETVRFANAPVKREIIETLRDGPALTTELRDRNVHLRSLNSLSAHLSKLEQANAIERDGEGKWRLKAITPTSPIAS